MTKIDGTTKVVGLLGWPTGHSLSPAMHNAAFAALELNWIYVPLPLAPEKINDAIRSLRAFNLVGVNVTIPHKQAIMRYLDHIDEGARAIGAVNTVMVTEEGTYGYNTDGSGFLQSLLEADFNPEGAHCLILGAGGAARAAVYSLASAGASVITICNRTVERAAFLVDDLQSRFNKTELTFETLSDEALSKAASATDLVVNTTSVGMRPELDTCPWPDTVPLPDAIICDLVYNPPKTQFLQQAEAANRKTIDGIGMLVHQGASAFQIWTGQTPPIDVMRQTVLNGLLNNHASSD